MQMFETMTRLVVLAAACAVGCGGGTPPADGGDAASAMDVAATSDAVATGDSAVGDAASGDGGRRRGTGTITGTVGGAAATPVDVVFQPSTTCGGASGIYLATSGAPVVCANPVAGELRQPYIQMRVSARTVGTYNLVPEGMCTSTTTGRVFTASFAAEGLSTLDGASGTLEITGSTADEITGRINITFGMPSNGTLMGTFTATACPP